MTLHLYNMAETGAAAYTYTVSPVRIPFPCFQSISFASSKTSKVSCLLRQYIGQHGITHFHIENIDTICSLKPQLFTRDIHVDCEPLPVILMAENRKTLCRWQRIIRFCAVFLFTYLNISSLMINLAFS